MLLEKFNRFVKSQKWFSADTRVLLAVSGGVDSSVMMHLFNHAGIFCAIAHCNFRLRGKESDDDEIFVKEQAANLNLQFFVTRFDTEAFAAENHLSIQMAARELRYGWFEKVACANNFDFIAVAHNRDDTLETFFINLGRGTGINGLTGIPVASGKIIRPLLFAGRAEIEKYAEEKNIHFREDSSNASDKYLRNFMRHNIIPLFEDAFPHFRNSLSQNLEKLSDARILFQYAINLLIADIVRQENNLLYIDIPQLLKAPAPKTVLFEILRQYSFSSASIDEIFQLTQAIPGKQFYSSTHKLVKDRECFIVSKPDHEHQTKFYIEENTTTINRPLNLSFEVLDIDEVTIDRNAAVAQLDYKKLTYPLILRKWHAGDYFIPLGMSNMKKLSNFFIDIKLSIVDKENTWLLISGDQIAWIAGRRIDDRFKVTEETKVVLKIVMMQ
jgi:tRNA(Ile)-lysidine synthase